MDGIILTPLKQIHNPKGDVLHAIKKSDIGFDGFGEVYFSQIYKNNIKGWKKHTKTTLNIVVPTGKIKFVIYDDDTKEFFTVTLSKRKYLRLSIRAGLWVAFKGINTDNMLLNMTSIEHDPSESISKDLKEFNYAW